MGEEREYKCVELFHEAVKGNNSEWLEVLVVREADDPARCVHCSCDLMRDQPDMCDDCFSAVLDAGKIKPTCFGCKGEHSRIDNGCLYCPSCYKMTLEKLKKEQEKS